MALLARDRPVSREGPSIPEAVTAGQRSITLDVAELRFTGFTAVGIVVGTVIRIRQVGAEVAVLPPASGAYRVLKRVGLTTKAVGDR